MIYSSLLTLFFVSFAARTGAYDPLAVPDHYSAEKLDISVHDTQRNRDIPILVYLPPAHSEAPVVLFSHGLGGSRKGSSYLGEHWSARGYVVVCLQHPGSDESVWKGLPPKKRMKALRKAANFSNFLLRVQDVAAVLDQLQVWNQTSSHPLAGRLDLDRVGMSGHSFGAVTTQAVSGQQYWREKASYTDPRIQAALALSPSSPKIGDPRRAFGEVAIPWMLMTGTLDVAPIGASDVASRLAVYPALPPRGKYGLVLYKATHSAFTDHPLPGEREQRNPNHHRVILALSTAFWDAWLRKDEAARAWLDGNGPRSLMETLDHWQRK